MRRLTYQDCGVWADSAYGVRRVRRALSDAVSMYLGNVHHGLIRSLRGERPDDGWDEREAVDMLNAKLAAWAREAAYNGGEVIELAFELDERGLVLRENDGT